MGLDVGSCSRLPLRAPANSRQPPASDSNKDRLEEIAQFALLRIVEDDLARLAAAEGFTATRQRFVPGRQFRHEAGCSGPITSPDEACTCANPDGLARPTDSHETGLPCRRLGSGSKLARVDDEGQRLGRAGKVDHRSDNR